MTLIVHTTEVRVNNGSTIGYGSGTDSDGNVVEYLGDWRMLLELPIPCDAEVEDWQITVIEPKP